MARMRKNATTATNNVTNNVTNNTNTRGENTMKNIETTTASVVVTLEKDGITVDFVQFHEGSVMYIVNKVPTIISTNAAVATIKQYLKDGWKKTVNDEEKLYAPEEPTPKKVEKTAEEKKAEREQRLTEKYGDLETRRAYVNRRQTIWAEESAKIAEAVKNGEMKRLRKDEWKALMNERVNARMSA